MACSLGLGVGAKMTQKQHAISAGLTHSPTDAIKIRYKNARILPTINRIKDAGIRASWVSYLVVTFCHEF